MYINTGLVACYMRNVKFALKIGGQGRIHCRPIPSEQRLRTSAGVGLQSTEEDESAKAGREEA